MNLKNPFSGMAYLTEKGVRPEQVFKRYSIEPFKYLLKYIDEQNNCFTVGRNGVGKTMVLSLFNPKYQEALFDNQKLVEESQKILELLPKDVISIYENIASPQIHLTRFQGKNLEPYQWQLIFGDYFGHILLKKLVLAIELICKNERWSSIIQLNNSDHRLFDSIAQEYGTKLGKVIEKAKSINSWESLKSYINERIKDWINAVSKLGSKTFFGPRETIELINPSLYLMSCLKNKKILKEKIRLFVIVDQYETLFDHRKIIDFRPVFNLAMQQASRGSTRMEFKIGVRPYGYKDNLNIIGSSAKLDLEKECKEIIIDQIIESYYKTFYKDLTMKCLNSTTGYKDFRKPSELFKKLAPVEEVKYYLGNWKSKEEHLKKFFNRSTIFKNKPFRREFLIENIIAKCRKNLKIHCSVWIETLLSVIIEKYLQAKSNIKLSKEQIIDEIDKNYKKLLKVQVNKCSLNNQNCFCSNISNDDIELGQYFSTMIKELRDGALFIICSAYKYPNKIYSGYNTLRLASSKIVLHYIELVSNILDEYLLRNPDEITKIPARIQSNAIVRRSNRLFNNISDTTPHGLSVKDFLRKLGIILRKKQLESALNTPTPNGFFSNVRIVDILHKIREKDIIAEVLSYGFLEEVERKPASLSASKKYAYYLNNLLCPHFGLSMRHFKVPINISGDPTVFLRVLLDKDPSIKKLERFIKLQEKNKDQTNLFDFIEDES